MKNKYWAVYQIVEPTNFKLTFVAEFTSENLAIQAIHGYVGGKFMIVENYH